jgi:hypothetical protein
MMQNKDSTQYTVHSTQEEEEEEEIEEEEEKLTASPCR